MRECFQNGRHKLLPDLFVSYIKSHPTLKLLSHMKPVVHVASEQRRLVAFELTIIHVYNHI
jgi:hypothetical protein